jgi:Phage Tail Collar Domain
MPYTINFSDQRKANSITVPDMPPGVNTLDTSLTLVGKNYPNYGQAFATDLVHLLENFAGPTPPQNPIEGQLWYDTSDVNNKVLRIMDGTASNARWPAANSIYQQGTDPRYASTQGLKNGDIWVDTTNNQLKIYASSDWTLVGPTLASGGEKTGPETVYLQDINNPPNSYPVTLNWVGGAVTSIFANNSFTPRVVIDGFSQIAPGINLPNTGAKLSGNSTYATGLTVNNSTFDSSEFLRKNDITTPLSGTSGQLITGRIVWLHGTPIQGQSGIVLKNDAQNPVTPNYVQLYMNGNDGYLLNNTVGGKLYLQLKQAPIVGSGMTTMVSVDNGTVGINTATSHATLDVFGSTRVFNTLTVVSTDAVAASIGGGVSIGGNLNIAGTTNVSDDVTVGGQLYINWNNGQAGSAILPGTASTTVTNTFDIGSASAQFRTVYAQVFGTTASYYYGTLAGPATRLAGSTQFTMNGQVAGTSFLFNGDNSVSANFTTTLTINAITAQTTVTSVSNTATFLVADGGNLYQISKTNLISNFFYTGVILPYGGDKDVTKPNSGAPTGFLWCDGTAYPIPVNNTSPYYSLFQVIGFRYTPTGLGSNFCVPNLMNSTVSTNNGTSTYIQYVIGL